MSAPRKSRAGDAFGRLGTAPLPTADTQAPRQHDTGTPRRRDATTSLEPVRRFTVRLYSEAEAEAVEDWTREARRGLGRKVDQARLVRELLRLVTTDSELGARVRERLAEPEQHDTGMS